jgi:hypothetical protein
MLPDSVANSPNLQVERNPKVLHRGIPVVLGSEIQPAIVSPMMGFLFVGRVGAG